MLNNNNKGVKMTKRKWYHNKRRCSSDILVTNVTCWGKKVKLYSVTVDQSGYQSIISKKDLALKVRKGLGYHQGIDEKDLERI